ncbi:MAG: porin [Desulfuromonas sp.]|mgnify:CR=1 FL=1|nr:MAG: porin [Desulfuromonas sp.]
MLIGKKSILLSVLLVLTALVSSALAGPTWTFGPDDQGMLKLDYKGQFQLTVDDTDEKTQEFNFRRNRLALVGVYGPKLGLYVQTEYSESTDSTATKFQMLDAVVRFKPTDNLNLWVGKFKYNFTRENLEACEKPLTLDRSLFIRSPYVSTRDKGVAVWGNMFDDMFQLRADVMNGRTGAANLESNLRYSVRAHLSLLDPEKGYGYRGTYLGKKTILTLGAAYQVEQDVALAGTDTVDLNAWTADIFAEYPTEELGTFTASAAIVDYDMDEANKSGATDTVGLNGEKNGGYFKVGYLLPNTPLQLFARSENWSFAELNGISGQELDFNAVGFNYYINGQSLKLTLEYSDTDYDKEDATTEDFTKVIAQMQVVF